MEEDRVSRDEKMIEKLRKSGIDISPEEIREESGMEIANRVHLANILVKKGYAPDVAGAFGKYLGLNGSAYVQKTDMSPEEGIKIIKNCGGMSVLAHPALIGLDESDFMLLLKKLKDAGLDGIESHYSSFSPKEIEYYTKIAKDYSLVQSAGSDFHGKNRIGVDIGDNYATGELYNFWLNLYNEKMRNTSAK